MRVSCIILTVRCNKNFLPQSKQKNSYPRHSNWSDQQFCCCILLTIVNLLQWPAVAGQPSLTRLTDSHAWSKAKFLFTGMHSKPKHLEWPLKEFFLLLQNSKVHCTWRLGAMAKDLLCEDGRIYSNETVGLLQWKDTWFGTSFEKEVNEKFLKEI